MDIDKLLGGCPGYSLRRAMNEKIDKLLGECPGYSLSLGVAEKQVWLDAQRAMLEAGYRKPRQPGEKRGKVKGEGNG